MTSRPGRQWARAEPTAGHRAFPSGPEVGGMGFGTYDESERGAEEVDTDEDGAVNVHEHDHDGDVSVEGDAETDELVDRLGAMKDDDEE